MLFINKLFNSIACLLSFTNLQLVIPGRTWILLYKARHAHKRLYTVLPKYSKIQGRTVYKRLWACLALYGGPTLWHRSNLFWGWDVLWLGIGWLTMGCGVTVRFGWFGGRRSEDAWIISMHR